MATLTNLQKGSANPGVIALNLRGSGNPLDQSFKHGQGLVDTTTQSLDRAQSNLAEIERILAEAEDQL